MSSAVMRESIDPKNKSRSATTCRSVQEKNTRKLKPRRPPRSHVALGSLDVMSEGGKRREIRNDKPLQSLDAGFDSDARYKPPGTPWSRSH